MQLPDWRSASVAPTMSRRPDPAALAAGQLQNKVQAVLPRPPPSTTVAARRRLSDGNSPVSQRQQITFRATLIFHLYHG